MIDLTKTKIFSVDGIDIRATIDQGRKAIMSYELKNSQNGVLFCEKATPQNVKLRLEIDCSGYNVDIKTMEIDDPVVERNDENMKFNLVSRYLMKNNNKCYAAGCDNNNIDYSCMYGDADNMPCQVNCYNCAKKCKKIMGVAGCKRFVNKHKFDK